MPKRALVVVDMVKDFVLDEGKLTCGKTAQAIIPFIVDKVRQFQAAGDLVVFAMDNHREDDPEFTTNGGPFPPHCIAGTEGAELVDELEALVRPDDLQTIKLPKQRYSAFYNTGLEYILKQAGVEELHVVGVCTHICVQQTVADAWYRQIPTVVYRDGVASFDETTHEQGLRYMRDILAARIL